MTEYNHDEPTPADHAWAEKVVGWLYIIGLLVAGLGAGALVCWLAR